MFPNINNELGVKACRELLEQREVLYPSTNSIIEGLLITLEEKVAQFGSTVVKQHYGTALGSHDRRTNFVLLFINTTFTTLCF